MPLTRQNWHFAFTYFSYPFYFLHKFLFLFFVFLLAATIKWEEKLHNNPFEIVGLSLNICVNIVTNARGPLSGRGWLLMLHVTSLIPHATCLILPFSNGWMMSYRQSSSQSTMSNFVARLDDRKGCRTEPKRTQTERRREREWGKWDAYACNNAKGRDTQWDKRIDLLISEHFLR